MVCDLWCIQNYYNCNYILIKYSDQNYYVFHVQINLRAVYYSFLKNTVFDFF